VAAGQAADRRGLPDRSLAKGDELHANPSTRRTLRAYQPMVAVIGKLDMQQLAAGLYPLSIRCFSKRIKISDIRTAISTTGWCR